VSLAEAFPLEHASFYAAGSETLTKRSEPGFIDGAHINVGFDLLIVQNQFFITGSICLILTLLPSFDFSFSKFKEYKLRS
jgi:hypothetical protein